MKTTLNQIRNNPNQKPCEDSWELLLKSLNKTKADDEPITFKYLLDILGVEDTLWIIDNCVDGELVKKRNMCADFAESVLHIWEDWAKDAATEHFYKPRQAINICRDINATNEEMAAAEAAAEATAWATGASGAAGASRAAAWATAEATAWATGATGASRAAGASSEREKQKLIILKYFK